tara:strand:+ start:469 stop:987 length:519 start_codon:yes stop_codon:yes gene_type:complete
MSDYNLILQGSDNIITGNCTRCTIINGAYNQIDDKVNAHVIGDNNIVAQSNSFYIGCSNGIWCDGDIVAYSTSDITLKDNIEKIENCVEKISSIDAVEFNWNENQEIYSGEDIGLIAQQVQEIAPEIVSERKDGYLAVKYEKLVPILVEAIKEQQVEIEQIQQTINEFKNHG